MDVGGEIYILRNSGSVSVAKEYVPAQSPSFAAIERDPQRLILRLNASSEKPFPPDAPHLNPLPGTGARRSYLFDELRLGDSSWQRRDNVNVINNTAYPHKFSTKIAEIVARYACTRGRAFDSSQGSRSFVLKMM